MLKLARETDETDDRNERFALREKERKRENASKAAHANASLPLTL